MFGEVVMYYVINHIIMTSIKEIKKSLECDYVKFLVSDFKRLLKN